MGDISDMVIEGDLCEQCGTYLDDDEDYPHLCPACEGNELEEDDG